MRVGAVLAAFVTCVVFFERSEAASRNTILCTVKLTFVPGSSAMKKAMIFKLDGSDLKYWDEDRAVWSTICTECGDSRGYRLTDNSQSATTSISRYTGRYSYVNIGDRVSVFGDGHCSPTSDPSKSAARKF
jgi:hypothetical protein